MQKQKKAVIAFEIREQFTVGLVAIVSGYVNGKVTTLLKKEFFTGGAEATQSMVACFMEEIKQSIHIVVTGNLVALVVPGSWDFELKKYVRDVCREWRATPMLVRATSALSYEIPDGVDCSAIWYMNAQFGEISVIKSKNSKSREIAWYPYRYSGIPFMKKIEADQVISLLDDSDSFYRWTKDEINIHHIFICGDVATEEMFITDLKEKYGDSISAISEELITKGALYIGKVCNEKNKLAFEKVRLAEELMVRYESEASSMYSGLD